MPKFSDEEVLSHLGGTPERVAADLQRFSEAARILSSNQPRLIDEHAGQWVAVFDGKVQASSRELREVLFELENKKIDTADAIIRLINDNDPPLIL